MPRFTLPTLITAAFVVASFVPATERDADPCRGGVLYGTVWVRPPSDPYTSFGVTVEDGRSAGWSGDRVTVHILQNGRVLASTRTDATGRYKFCGLPVRHSFTIVAVPADPSMGVHSELMTLTLTGGMQRNIYPARRLDPMPIPLRDRYDQLTARSPAYAGAGTDPVRAANPTISEYRTDVPTSRGIADPAELGRIRWMDGAAPAVTDPEWREMYTPRAAVPDDRSRIFPTPSRDDRPTYLPAPTPRGVPDARGDEPLRVVAGDGLTLYFTGSVPRYMLLEIDGTDGRGCFFEFDQGVDAQIVERTGNGFDLLSPSWGRIHVARPRADIVTIDLGGVYTPVCRTREPDGRPLAWIEGANGWTRMPPA